MSQSAAKPLIPPLLVLIVGVFAVSVSAILIRFAQGDAVPSLVIAAWRLTFASLILLPICWFKKRDELMGLHSAEIVPATLSGIFLAIHFAAWISSLNYTTVVSSTVLVSTSPVWVAVAAPFILNERSHFWVKLGIGLALLGSIIISFTDLINTMASGQLLSNTVLLGNGLALTGGMTGAAYLIIGRKLRATLSLLTYITIVYSMAALTLMLFALISQAPLFGYGPRNFALFLLMALIPQLLGHSSFNYALGYLSADYVTITLISEPIGAAILSLIIFGERPTIYTIVGCILILMGIISASRQPT